jgi:hypothetical protein
MVKERARRARWVDAGSTANNGYGERVESVLNVRCKGRASVVVRTWMSGMRFSMDNFHVSFTSPLRLPRHACSPLAPASQPYGRN